MLLPRVVCALGLQRLGAKRLPGEAEKGDGGWDFDDGEVFSDEAQRLADTPSHLSVTPRSPLYDMQCHAMLCYATFCCIQRHVLSTM